MEVRSIPVVKKIARKPMRMIESTPVMLMNRLHIKVLLN